MDRETTITMTELTIKTHSSVDGSYKITIAAGILNSLIERISDDFRGRHLFIVTDSNLESAGHLSTLIGDHDLPTFIISPAGEISKHIQTVVSIVETMEKNFLGRDSVIVALGGGTVGDIAGFAASIFKRGVAVVHIPTTTVSQADSSIGGKTGVDSSLSKNAFGTFYQPSGVYIDVATLETLPDNQYNAGLVESIKHAIIADAAYFNFINDNIDSILSRDNAVLKTIAEYNCRIKGHVVEIDPTEQNLRQSLNYGHTIGHAVETTSNFELLHGEAVAIGIIAAGLIEKRLELVKDERLAAISNIFCKLNQPLTIDKRWPKSDIIEALKRDKKAVNQQPRFVLVEQIGKVHSADGRYSHTVSSDIVESVLDELYQY